MDTEIIKIYSKSNVGGCDNELGDCQGVMDRGVGENNNHTLVNDKHLGVLMVCF